MLINRLILIFFIFLLIKKIKLDKENKFKYLFSLIDNYFPYRHHCFATSINEDHLLTSADCVLNKNLSLISIKYNSISKNELNQRFKIRSINIHRNYNQKQPNVDNIALIKIDNNNKKYSNKFYNLNRNLEFSIDDYRTNELKSIIILSTNLTNYIIIEQNLNLLDYEQCLPRLVNNDWFWKKNELSANSICTEFYAGFKNNSLNDHRKNNKLKNNLKSFVKNSLIIDWNMQLGSPLIINIKNNYHFVGFLIKINNSTKPLVFLRLSLYFDWLHKFIN